MATRQVRNYHRKVMHRTIPGPIAIDLSHLSMDKLHPEQQEGEVCLGLLPRHVASAAGWLTSRLGKPSREATDAPGEPPTGHKSPLRYPVFVQAFELEALGLRVSPTREQRLAA